VSPPPPPPHVDLERFARGEPIAVEVGEIERELAALWKRASATSAPRAEGAVSRAALWNVIIPARGRENLAATKHLVDEIAPALPTRTITLCLDEAPAAGARGGVQASIENNVASQPGGTRMVYSEEITLTGPRGAEAHFGAIVRGLGIPGVPTATFWLDPALPASLLERELLPATDRLVLDTGGCFTPKQLADLQRLVERARPVPVADLGWLRLGGLRSLFAGLFDPPVGGAPLARATRLEISHLAGCDASALLIVSWLGTLLGWRPLGAAYTPEGGIRYALARGDAAGAALEAHLVPAEGPCGKSGILTVELSAGDERYAIHRTALDKTALLTPVAPPKPVTLDSPSDAELAVAALGRRGRDPLFARCLGFAQTLWALEPVSDASRR
jgi:glucose-6-phosphate dehydrogenase assembly protein OpcA